VGYESKQSEQKKNDEKSTRTKPASKEGKALVYCTKRESTTSGET
jgi:hypothetical protein